MSTLDLSELRAVDRADVWKQGRPAASLTRTGEGVRFDYLESWVAEGGSAVATSLPLTREPLLRPGGALPAYFSGLLPEGRRFGALRRQVKTSADDELSLLLAVGADAVGDVQVVPAGEHPDEVPPRVRADDLATVSYRELLADLGIRAERTALPGVQDKASAAMLNLPLARRGERWILKLTPPEYPHLVANEACFLAAARLAGLPVATARVEHDRDGVPGLLVRRFDRPAGGGQLAVEDGAQVLGVPPADKYRVGTEELLAGLAAVCAAPLPALRALFAQLVFVVLTANGDAHAKNFAVLQGADGEWRPSPAYDLPSTQPYGDLSLALTLGGRQSRDPGCRDLMALAAAVGLPAKAARRVIEQQVERVEAWLPLVRELPFDHGVVVKLERVIAHRRHRLRQGMD